MKLPRHKSSKSPYVEFVCARQKLRKEKSYDVFEYAFFSNKEITRSRFHFSSATALISPKDINILGVWVHEFTEMALVELLNDWEEPWRKEIKFEKYNERIPHIIAFLVEKRLSKRRFLW